MGFLGHQNEARFENWIVCAQSLEGLSFLIRLDTVSTRKRELGVGVL